MTGLIHITQGRLVFYTCLDEATVDKKIFEALKEKSSFLYNSTSSQTSCKELCSSYAFMFFRPGPKSEGESNCFCLQKDDHYSSIPLRLPFSVYPSDVTSSHCRQGTGDFGLYCRQGFSYLSKIF